MKNPFGKLQLIKMNSYQNDGDFEEDNPYFYCQGSFLSYDSKIDIDQYFNTHQNLAETKVQGQIEQNEKANSQDEEQFIVGEIQNIEVPIENQIFKKKKGKNFPKQIGNYLIKHIKQFPEQEIPIGIQQLKNQADLMKKNGKQLSFAISDFRNACQDKKSQKYLKDFLKNKLPLYQVHSNMIYDPTENYGLIVNAYVGACNPQLWKGNSQIERIK
ncbi:unnamed protein product [Paramecium sonneborni]|uniref:Uncharacterized protein n=1 Tax=Paramecium sonneborni TaxID=65129 RepID=A0A8S1Q9L0_9CILI|nr:unnamed protein product [Paramecium sonneborni]